MFRGSVLAVATLFVVLGTAYLQADTRGGKGGGKQPTPTPNLTQTLYGVIKSVDVKGNTVILTTGTGEKARDVTVTVTDKTIIYVDGKNAKLEEVKENMKAAVRVDAKQVAVSITANTVPPAK